MMNQCSAFPYFSDTREIVSAKYWNSVLCMTGVIG